MDTKQQEIKQMSDTELLAAMQLNDDIQKRNHPDTVAATQARRANRPLFAEAARRNLKGSIT